MEKQDQYIRRFQPSHTILHLMVIVSFLTLAITGMTLKFPDNFFFSAVSGLLGGPVVTGYLHRLGAMITFAYAGIHLAQLVLLYKRKKITIRGLLTEEYSLIPLPRDLIDLVHNLRYFLGKAEKPKFGRWTYWEKFDYMAVFWGITVIGLSGLILWFPETATIILPGWAINVATIIHSDEALLATGFIFTIHFFNTHLRPEAFPMDKAIFTQRLPLSTFKEDRPREYATIVQEGKLDNYLVPPLSPTLNRTVKIVGFSFLTFGIIIVIAIIYALVFV
jgi:cytochrome b subunit of formate dehydrogenase